MKKFYKVKVYYKDHEGGNIQKASMIFKKYKHAKKDFNFFRHEALKFFIIISVEILFINKEKAQHLDCWHSYTSVMI